MRDSQQLQDEDANASQVWGGEDVRLQMNTDGATVEFDCAEGTISEPIKADASGEFTARGTYTPGQFGPVRKNSSPREMPATYKGTISGTTMHLQVVVEKKEIQPPSFTLIQGDHGRVHRCH